MFTKLFNAILVLVSAILLVSTIIYLAPVDPARLSFGQMSDASSVELKRAQLGLDKPLITQLRWYLNDLSPISYYSNDRLKSIKVGYLGIFKISDGQVILKYPWLRESYQSGRKVSNMLVEAIPQTAILAVASMLLAIILGVSLGIISAYSRGSWLDQFIIGLSTLGTSLPGYIPAMVISLIFGFILASITGLEVQGSLFELNDFGDTEIRFKNVLLPAIALGIRPISQITHLTRNAMLDVLNMEFMKTSIAKGSNIYRQIFKHCLPNASIPIVTTSSSWLASLLTGSFFVETIFNYKGLGNLTVNALLSFDVPVVLGCLIFTCVIYTCMNLIVDALIASLDPRVRFIENRI